MLSSYENELKLNNHQRATLGAFRTGAKDARIDSSKDFGQYGARSNSAWAKWYCMGYDGLSLPADITSKGVTA